LDLFLSGDFWVGVSKKVNEGTPHAGNQSAGSFNDHLRLSLRLRFLDDTIIHFLGLLRDPQGA